MPSKPPLEKTIETWACRYAKEQYGVDNMKMGSIYQNDWPDRQFFFPQGRPLFIEFKRLGKKPTPAQEHRIERLRQQGYIVYVCDNKAEAKQILDAHAAKRKLGF